MRREQRAPRKDYDSILRSLHRHWVDPWNGERYAPLSEVREWLTAPMIWINEQENRRQAQAYSRYGLGGHCNDPI